MKIESKIIDMTLKINLTILKPSLVSMIDLPLPLASTPIWTKENNPPVKSKSTFSSDHPTVDCLFQFKYTYGRYFTNVIAALQYPAILIVPQFWSKYPGLPISIPKMEKMMMN